MMGAKGSHTYHHHLRVDVSAAAIVHVFHISQEMRCGFPLQLPHHHHRRPPVLTSPCPFQVLLQDLNIPKVQTSRNGVYFPLSCACDALGNGQGQCSVWGMHCPRVTPWRDYKPPRCQTGGVTSPQGALGYSQGLQMIAHLHQASKLRDFCNSGHGCMGKGK